MRTEGKLPEKFDGFYFLPPDSENEEGFIYRVDKPVLAINVDEKDMEVVLLHQTREDLTNVDLGTI